MHCSVDRVLDTDYFSPRHEAQSCKLLWCKFILLFLCFSCCSTGADRPECFYRKPAGGDERTEQTSGSDGATRSRTGEESERLQEWFTKSFLDYLN